MIRIARSAKFLSLPRLRRAKRAVPYLLLALFVLSLPLASLAQAEGGVWTSGIIEADTIEVTSQVTGRITEIGAETGDEVSAGQILFALDTTDLMAQERQALAALAAAHANLSAIVAPARAEEVAAAEAELAQAVAARDGAAAVWYRAQEMLANPLEIDRQIEAAQSGVVQAQALVERAQASLHGAEARRDAAAQRQTNDEETTQYQVTVKQAEAEAANLAAAQAQLAGAQEQLALLQAMRQNPVALNAQVTQAWAAYRQAEGAVALAQARLDGVKAEAMAEEVAVAEAQVRQAEATLARVRAQARLFSYTAPGDGVILSRTAQPGELAVPGVTLMTFAHLDRVTLRVFVPEKEIGRVSLGQKAVVGVDAYPGESFTGKVVYISPRAEYTPSDVQTEDERSRLVFAVKVEIENEDHRLKPGMTAEAEILNGG